ncbi:ABC transporter substrate-binding protein [Variovorax sp. VNK109]|uniref:ABC transporter substrate-binding protein n=1 Tax=Variovorax sp. VNK109 TaxID=3400919 RepID=UPI003C0E2793
MLEPQSRARHALRLVAAALGLAFAASAVNAQSVLRVRPFGDLKGIDPIVNSDYMARNHGYMVYDTLFAMDEKLAIKPQMLERYTVSPDQLTYTFVLRDGLKFHDGSAVTSADVVASLQRWGQRDGLGQQLTARTAELVAVDAKTVRLKMKEAWGLVLDALGKPSSNVPFIMPERIAKTPATTGITDPIGSGPFIMKKDEWLPGAKVVYVKNPAYVPRSDEPSGLAGAKRANVDRVEWLNIPDTQTAVNALQKGELDIFEEVPSDMIKDLARNNAIRVVPQDSLGVQAVFRFNSTQPPFNNPKVREAVLAAVDQETFLRAAVDDPKLYKVCASFYMCTSPYYTNANYPKPDLNRAKQLLKDSGYKGEPVVVLHGNEGLTNIFSLVAEQMMRDMGMKVDAQSMDWGTLTARRTSKNPPGQGGWSLFISAPTGADMMDPLGHLGLRSNCDKAWFGWPCDEELEKLRDQFATAADTGKRADIARAVQVRALQTLPYVPLGQLYLVRAQSAKLSGALNAAVPVYWNIRKAP